jgi:hypothetical protein
MKKCGVKPIVDTYIQLAHGVCTLQKLQRKGTPPKPRYILEILSHIDELEGWASHKNVGVLFAALANTARDVNRERTDILEQLAEAAHILWENVYPDLPMTSRNKEDIEYDLNHYILVLSMSPKSTDWMKGRSLLPYLKKLPSISSRHNALRIAACLRDQNLAKEFWEYFNKVPFHAETTLTYLRILSKTADVKEATNVLDYYIENVKPEYPRPPAYVFALLSAAFLPNLDGAMRIYKRIRQNPNLRDDFPLHALLLNIFRSATTSEYSRKKQKPEFIYAILRTLKMPDLLRRTDIAQEKRLDLIKQAQKIITWRLEDDTLREDERHMLVGDEKFYERWEGIIMNEGKKKDGENDVEEEPELPPEVIKQTKSGKKIRESIQDIRNELD